MKYFFCSILIIFSISSAMSQLAFYPSVGVNYSKTFASSESNERLAGYYGGVHAQAGLSDNWMINIEGQFSQKGYDNRDDDNQMGVEAAKYNYVDLLAGLEYKFFSIIGFGLGTNIALKTSEKQYYSDVWHANSISEINPMDLGYYSAVSLYFSKFRFHIHFNNSLIPIDEIFVTDNNGSVTETLKFKNANIQLGIGYKIF